MVAEPGVIFVVLLKGCHAEAVTAVDFYMDLTYIPSHNLKCTSVIWLHDCIQVWSTESFWVKFLTFDVKPNL